MNTTAPKPKRIPQTWMVRNRHTRETYGGFCSRQSVERERAFIALAQGGAWDIHVETYKSADSEEVVS